MSWHRVDLTCTLNMPGGILMWYRLLFWRKVADTVMSVALAILLSELKYIPWGSWRNALQRLKSALGLRFRHRLVAPRLLLHISASVQSCQGAKGSAPPCAAMSKVPIPNTPTSACTLLPMGLKFKLEIEINHISNPEVSTVKTVWKSSANTAALHYLF